ncbi:hypothetical protein H0H93_008120 [Arthromyces matolae]|nr:hypothetical protein H0H93_008120 [Arthromyces matolae]
MSVSTPLLDTIEADEPSVVPTGNISPKNPPPREPVVLTPTSRTTSNNAQRMATTEGDAESGIAGIFRQSAHPLALFCLYFFRVAAITVYILCGFFTDNYVLSTVIVVVLLAMDFWNCRNVAGRTLVGLRFWNQVDDDGESYWVFESRDGTRVTLRISPRAQPTQLIRRCSGYIYLLIPLCSVLTAQPDRALLVPTFMDRPTSSLAPQISFIPIVILALVFNFTNAIGFTYAYVATLQLKITAIKSLVRDRDAKQKWANGMGSTWGLGGIGGQILAGAVKNSVGRVFQR